MSQNPFLLAAKVRLRFPSPAGLLSTEDLFKIPLRFQSEKKASVEGIGNALLKQQKDLEGGSIMGPETPSKEKETVDLMVTIVREVIAVRSAENKAKLEESERRRKKAELIQAIESRTLAEAPLADLKKQLAAL